jgi:hypothetical protein
MRRIPDNVLLAWNDIFEWLATRQHTIYNATLRNISVAFYNDNDAEEFKQYVKTRYKVETILDYDTIDKHYVDIVFKKEYIVEPEFPLGNNILINTYINRHKHIWKRIHKKLNNYSEYKIYSVYGGNPYTKTLEAIYRVMRGRKYLYICEQIRPIHVCTRIPLKGVQ